MVVARPRSRSSPIHIASTAPPPLSAAARQNQIEDGGSRRRHIDQPNQAPSASSAVPIPTMPSKARCSSVFAGGCSSSGMSLSPVTTVSVLKPTSSESRPGIPIPNLTSSSVQMPPIHSVWLGPVS